MRTRRWMSGLGLGVLVLAGAVLAGPIAGVAQDDDANEQEGSPLGNPTLDPEVGLVEAQEIALDGQAGAVVRAVELEGENGVLVWEIELDNGVEVEVDGSTGEILETEQSDDQDEDDD